MSMYQYQDNWNTKMYQNRDKWKTKMYHSREKRNTKIYHIQCKWNTKGTVTKGSWTGISPPHPTLPPSLLGLKPSPSTGHNEDGLDWSIG